MPICVFSFFLSQESDLQKQVKRLTEVAAMLEAHAAKHPLAPNARSEQADVEIVYFSEPGIAPSKHQKLQAAVGKSLLKFKQKLPEELYAQILSTAEQKPRPLHTGPSVSSGAVDDRDIPMVDDEPGNPDLSSSANVHGESTKIMEKAAPFNEIIKENKADPVSYAP